MRLRMLGTLTALLASTAGLHGQAPLQPANTDPGSPSQAQPQLRQPFAKDETATIRIRLLNGKTGQPIANEEIFLERSKTHLMSHAEDHEIKTDASGLAEATVAKSGSVLNPVVIDYKSCTPRVRHDNGTEKSEAFPVAQILASGVVAQNKCGKSAQSPTPGELTLYYRTMNVFERITD